MRIVKIVHKTKPSWGIVKADRVILLKGDPFERISCAGESIALAQARFLAPAAASKIVLAGLNYKGHAGELGMKIPKEPVIFLKPVTSLIAHKDNIIYPKGVIRLDYEAELAAVIRKKAKNIAEKKVKEYILGYTCLNDVTARDLQKKDAQWTRAKSFDTFCPCGPWLETEIDPASLAVKSYLNGKLKQDSNTSNFIFSLECLVAFISRIMTLLPGDIISTGTPPGVGKMKPGDCIEVCIEGIGTLSNRVA
ncbi:MAG: fumarylacetoacetate hydrolase family protein [Candidatus Omnitrophica bacterium]|nr:fumarylacetoacetate hydrolase family protein [Candidatus Omnitrophota bacterium]